MQFFLRDSLICYKLVMLSAFVFSENVINILLSEDHFHWQSIKKKKRKKKLRIDPKRAIPALFITFQENSEDDTSLVTDLAERQNPPWKCSSASVACDGWGNGGGCAVAVRGEVCK